MASICLLIFSFYTGAQQCMPKHLAILHAREYSIRQHIMKLFENVNISNLSIALSPSLNIPR